MHPASQGAADASDDKSAAVRAKACDEVISHRSDDAGINRRKREPGCSSGISDRDPAVNDVLSEPCANLRRIDILTHQRNDALTHAASLTGPHNGPARRLLMPHSALGESLWLIALICIKLVRSGIHLVFKMP